MKAILKGMLDESTILLLMTRKRLLELKEKIYTHIKLHGQHMLWLGVEEKTQKVALKSQLGVT